MKEQELENKVEELTTVKARDELVEDLRKVGEEYSEEKTHALVARLNQKMESQFLHFHNQYKKKFQFLKQKQKQGDCDEDEPATQEWTDGEAALLNEMLATRCGEVLRASSQWAAKHKRQTFLLQLEKTSMNRPGG